MLLRKRLWAVLLVGLLMIGLLVGIENGDEAVAKEPRATLGKIMVPPAAFTPTNTSWDYDNSGSVLQVNDPFAFFHAPLRFPVPEVYIRKIMLIAYDNSGDSRDVCVTLYRAEPLKPGLTSAGVVCTVDSTNDPQKVARTALSPRRMNTANHGPYLSAAIDTGTKLYGVQVVYSY